MNANPIDPNNPLPINGPAVLDLTSVGRSFVLRDSTPPSNYAIDLGHFSDGTTIEIRVADDAQRIFAIGNEIDGDRRHLIAGERVLLLREVGGWTRIGGYSRPFAGHRHA